MAKRIVIDVKRVEELAGRGLTQEQIAHSLGISERTLYNRRNESEELDIAIKRGSAKGIEQVANALFESALGGNTTAMIFYLKARAGWSDKNYLEITAHQQSREEQFRQKELEGLTNEQILDLLKFNELDRQSKDKKERTTDPVM